MHTSIIENVLTQIRQIKPLILNVTNYVTMDFIANGLLSVGAAPIMSCAKQEVPELSQLAHSVVINLGTLNEEFITLCNLACKTANALNKPLLLDPVGAGATPYRTQTALTLLKKYRFNIICGNAAEIMALAGAEGLTQGVDSNIAVTEKTLELGKHVSTTFQTTVVISGATDYIIQNKKFASCPFGSTLMPRITGSGCLLTSVIAAFHAIEADPFKAAVDAVMYYARCGARAGECAQGPGSFRMHFLDCLNQ